MYVGMYAVACTYVAARMYVCMYLDMYVAARMYVCMPVGMYAAVCTHAYR